MPLDHQLLKKSKFCLVSDLDWTMVDHHDPTHEKLLGFNRLWTTHFAQDSLLVFSTGRSQHLFNELTKEVPLLIPDILICSVGTEIYIHGSQDQEWITHLDQKWNRDLIVNTIATHFPTLTLQQPSEQRPHKVSYKVPSSNTSSILVSDIKESLVVKHGLDVSVIFSGGEDLDILPSRASKGKALEFLLKQLSDSSDDSDDINKGRKVMVAGDSGNDVELFVVDGVYGCIVANAHAELKEWYENHQFDDDKKKKRIFVASEDGPGGIFQALYHFEFVQQVQQLQLQSQSQQLRRKAVVDLHAWFEHCYNLHLSPTENNKQHAEEGLKYFEMVMADDFELVGPEGKILRKKELVGFFRKVIDDVATKNAHDGITKRVWIDQYSEREVVPGSNVWLVRYMELQQSFVESEKKSDGSGIVSKGRAVEEKTARWSSALLRLDDGVGYRWMYVHETWI